MGRFVTRLFGGLRGQLACEWRLIELRMRANMEASIRIFLSYAPPDERLVHYLYADLARIGFHPWKAPIDVRAGENWQANIEAAICQSDFFLVCLSKNSVDKEGVP